MLKTLLRYIRGFFSFTHGEAKGFLFMVGLLIFLSFLYLVYRNIPTDTYQSYEEDKELLDSLVAILEKRRPETEDGAAGAPVAGFKTKFKTAEATYFDFDPNRLSEDSLQQLGIPQWLARRIGRYREKGGKFRKKEDLLKIYDFPDSLFRNLAPYIRIVQPRETEAGEKKVAEERATYERGGRKDAENPVAALSLNEADSLALLEVKGIGPVLAGRIIRFRDKLGGFVSGHQLFEVYGLDSAVAKRLIDRAYLPRNFRPKQININTAGMEELAAHPYISPSGARLIEAYRLQHGEFKSLNDLQKIHTLDINLVEKIAPYIRLE